MVQWEFDFEDKKEPEPIWVMASREPVKPRRVDDEDSSIHVIKDGEAETRKSRFGDRTPVRLEESITDESAKGAASDTGGKPDFRIGGRISDDFDDVNDGVV